MTKSLAALGAFLCIGVCVTVQAPARAAQFDDVLKRLEALEQENTALRDRVRRLEGRKIEPNTPQAAAGRSPAGRASVAASMAPTEAYAAFKAPPAIPAPAFNWSGFYVGGHAGWGFQTTTVNDPFSIFVGNGNLSGVPVRSINGDGFLGGVQAGWNYQIGQLVVGTEVNVSWTDISGSRTDVLASAIPGRIDNDTRTWSEKTQWLGTATTRFGYAWERWLLYTKAGIAGSRSKYGLLDVSSSVFSAPPSSVTSTLSVSGADTRIGWIFGAGVEWAFWNNWSALIEYNYLDFGNEPVLLSGRSGIVGTGGFAGINTSGPIQGVIGIEQRIQTLRFGVNYRFAPTLAP